MSSEKIVTVVRQRCVMWSGIEIIILLLSRSFITIITLLSQYMNNLFMNY